MTLLTRVSVLEPELDLDLETDQDLEPLDQLEREDLDVPDDSE